MVRDRVPPCSAEGPGCPDCPAVHVHCLLPVGHDGDHRHDDTRCWPITRCRPITWPAVPGEDKP